MSDHLIKAVEHRDIDAVRELITINGIDLNAIGGFPKTTPLVHAILLKRDDIMRILLAAGASVSIDEPLIDAAHAGFVSGVQLLLEYKVDPDQYLVRRRVPEVTALEIAIQKGHRIIAGLLIAYGANANIKNGLILRHALRCKKYDFAQMLLAAGAIPQNYMLDLITDLEIKQFFSAPLPLQQLCRWKLWFEHLRSGYIIDIN